MMQRTATDDLMRNVHIESLMQKYPNTSVASNETSSVTYKVESEGKIGVLVLYVHLDAQFPVNPPVLTTFCNKVLTALSGITWDKNKTILAEFVEAAFEKLSELWGDATPPRSADVTPSFASLPDDVLKDLISNPYCLESFVFQLPLAKQYRELQNTLLLTLEAKAQRNLSFKPKLEALTEEISQLQEAARAHTDRVLALREEATGLQQFGTTEGLLRSYVAEMKAISAQTDSLCDGVLNAHSSADKDVCLEEFIRQRKLFHFRDLKRRAFLGLSGHA